MTTKLLPVLALGTTLLAGSAASAGDRYPGRGYDPPAPGGCRPGGRGDFECRARQCVTRCYPPPPAPRNLRTLEITNGLNTQYWTIDMDTQRIVTEAPPAPPAPGGCRPGGRGDFECRARQCVTRCYPPPPAPAPGPTVIVAPGGCRTWDRGELEHRIRCLVRENFGHCVCHVRVDADLACRKVRVQVETREYHVIRQVGNLLASRPELAGLTIYVERD